jgi:ABC-type nitrate/sulfonate/bicarbonate transport system substrate-binding protein
MGGSQELTQSLYGGPEINDIQDFKGKILAVDAVATGYAVVLRYILQCHGLHFKEDYDLEPVGSSQARLEKIAKGKLAGAMLNPRYAQRAEAPRLHLLAAGRDYAHPYPSRVGFTSRAWANSHSSLLVGFIQASLIAIEWLLDPQHSSEASSLIQRAFRQTEEQARISYEKAVDPTGVFASKAAFSPDALRTVLDLRVKTGLMKAPAPPIEKYYDASFYQKARATARV